MHIHFLSLIAIASFVIARPGPESKEVPDTPFAVEFPDGEDSLPYPEANHTLVTRDEPPWPGVFSCQQRNFRKPCTWEPTGGKGALDCHRIKYGASTYDPDSSFGPDKGVTCKMYGGSNCESTTPILVVEYPGGNLLDLGRNANSFPKDSVEGFFSYRCRSWKQTESDPEQTKYLPLPKKP
ncbi:uncharacterized protein HMPREF1541_04744 [Cyphellophora europaea CBS 101466]|uniref:Ig-like domain-containing protein n=1 Tax=Cyphellophora europaea (strain CBS 101466) TaxID=1220924 RepID=W2RVK8_CYPE1|nr:uncharacterized protein HMPREF1541_04744 [Cyphellophora europaea CBS 101466]ETN40467.1 hypothetical protein HMPREF1541_04744 [Cyphellophora europaea CBS 101466]